VITWHQASWLGKGANRTEHKKSTRKASRAGSWGEKKRAAERGENILREDIRAKRYGGLYFGNQK